MPLCLRAGTEALSPRHVVKAACCLLDFLLLCICLLKWTVLFSSLFITTQHRHRSLQHFSQTEVYTSGYSNHEFEPLRTHVCMKCKCGGAAAESVSVSRTVFLRHSVWFRRSQHSGEYSSALKAAEQQGACSSQCFLKRPST